LTDSAGKDVSGDLEEDEEDKERKLKFYSEFEKKCTNGRWIMEKKHQFYQDGARVIH
jgi:hypothetical protein